MEYGKCVVCGEDIGPYIGDGSDSLCKHCHDKGGSLPLLVPKAFGTGLTRHQRADSYLPATRRRSAGGGWEPVFTMSDLHESRQWQDEIDERLDNESVDDDDDDDDNGAAPAQAAVYPKQPRPKPLSQNKTYITV